MRFDSKCTFNTPTVLLGLLLCAWTWGISSYGRHQMVNTEIRFTISLAVKDGEALYSQQKQDQKLNYGSDHELLIAKFRLKCKKVGKTTRPSRYD